MCESADLAFLTFLGNQRDLGYATPADPADPYGSPGRPASDSATKVAIEVNDISRDTQVAARSRIHYSTISYDVTKRKPETKIQGRTMNREKFTEKLARMIQTIEAGALPARVKEFYAFGSYARGALEPGDLDVIVVHDDPGCEYWKALKRECSTPLDEIPRFRTQMRRALRRPGERIDMVIVESLDRFIRDGGTITRAEVILLWSDTDRDWRPKIEGIRPNPAAGRAKREQLFPIRRLSADLATMEEVMAMIADRQLVFNHLPIASIACRLTPYHEEQLARCRWRVGRKSLLTFPYALQWLQTHHQRVKCIKATTLHNDKQTHRVEVGRPSLARMLYYFTACPNLKCQCLIPHFKKAGPNELLLFARGPNWRESES